MKKTLFSTCLFLLMAVAAYSQAGPALRGSYQKTLFYLGVGTNRSFYSRSDITVRSSASPSFDFTLDKVRARDDGGLKFNGGGAAQYSYIAGFYSRKKNFGLEFNFDHLKYFVRQNQSVYIKGQINGGRLDKDTVLSPGFFQFEHSDGANYAMLQFMKWKPLLKSANGKSGLDLMLKAGAGVVVPKTNSTIMGRHYDDAYILSGYVAGLESGVRYSFFRHLFAAGSFKAAYANYTHFKIAGGSGHQDWFSGQFNILVGAQF